MKPNQYYYPPPYQHHQHSSIPPFSQSNSYNQQTYYQSNSYNRPPQPVYYSTNPPARKPNQEWSKRPVMYPSLPNRGQIDEQIKKLDYQIQLAKVNLSSLTKERNRLSTDTSLQSIRIRPSNVDNYRGLQIDRNLIDSFLSDNKEKINKSHEESQVSNTTKYRRIFDLPQYRDMLVSQHENLTSFFSVIYGYKKLSLNKNQELLKKYLSYNQIKTEYLEPSIDSINLIQHVDKNFWGPEQHPETTVPFEGPDATSGCSPDVEQHHTNGEWIKSESYFNNNNFVEDPQKAHEAYKKRIYWSDKDKETFYELFWSMPHKFRKIASHFPGRTTKDMIEFYYTTKTTFDFESARSAYQKRSQQALKKKKVITEGTVKRH